MRERTILTAEQLRAVLSYNPETGEFRRLGSRGRWKNGSIAGHLRDDGYWIIRLGVRDYLGHRLAWLYMTGHWPADEVDHKDRVRSNNRWANLRPATRIQQHQNKGGHGKSGLKGASWRKDDKTWEARIKIDGKIRHLGRFASAEEAHAAYVAAARRAFGEFACAAHS